MLSLILDSVSPLERIKLVQALSSALEALQAASTPLEKLKGANAVNDALAALGVEGEQEPSNGDDELSDDPNSPNYRYKDTGYIAGSRKELAQGQIFAAKKSGLSVLSTDIDWDAIEENPRLAAEIITKSNLFGKTDWQALKEKGMDAGAAFLIDRIYASIGKDPAEENAQSRKDYALALNTIRKRLEGCLTVDSVRAVVGEIRDELSGSQLNADETDEHEKLQAEIDVLLERYRALDAENSKMAKAAYAPQKELRNAEWEQGKRTRRGWKPDPELQKKIEELKAVYDKAVEAHVAWQNANPEYMGKNSSTTEKYDGGSYTKFFSTSGLRHDISQLKDKQYEITKLARVRNIVENPLTRGWISFGDKFLELITGRSKTFASHTTNARMGRIDWSWAEKETTTVKRASKTEVRFQLKVADNFERRGGRDISVKSTKELKEMMGFRDIQSGNWVLKDPASAQFHTQQTAGAMADLSDIIGIDMKSLGLGGRLALAFGARGTGNAGWGGAAAAHYEPVERVINITKMGGGGSLAHEWFHAIDDMVTEIAGGLAGGKEKRYASTFPELLPDGEVRSAMEALTKAIKSGDIPAPKIIKCTDKDVELAKANVTDRSIVPVAVVIREAKDAKSAIASVFKYYEGATSSRVIKHRDQWASIALAYHIGKPDIGLFSVGEKVSSFYAEAIKLDNGIPEKYWSRVREMGARAFQSFVEDKLESQGRKNDYLSCFADNKYYKDPFFGDTFPFPEGDERKRINDACERLFSALSRNNVLDYISQDDELLDMLFGEPDNILDSSPSSLPSGSLEKVFDWLDKALIEKAESNEHEMRIKKSASTNSRYYSVLDVIEGVRVSDHTKKVFDPRTGGNKVNEIDFTDEYEDMIDKFLRKNVITQSDKNWFYSALEAVRKRIQASADSGKKAAETRAKTNDNADDEVKNFMYSKDGIEFLKSNGLITNSGKFKSNSHKRFAQLISSKFPKARKYNSERLYEFEIAGKGQDVLLGQ